MRTILLVMRRELVAQGLLLRLQEFSGLRPLFEPSYLRAQAAVQAHGAGAVLIEVAESGRRHRVSNCLALCDRLREESPGCKLLLMCPERDEAVVARAVEAKQRGRIDDFVFYDVTVDYLASKLLCI